MQNFNPHIDIIPARKRGTPYNPDDEQILQPLLHANIIFMGPGSPTYAVRQLRGSLAWELLRARHRLGAALVFASAAVIAIGAYSLPVYEIYKVGEDVSLVPGLDLFSDLNLPLSVIPHWNNTDGGDEIDTSRCFIGIERFIQWCNLLPTGYTTVGLDEHTGLIIDFDTGKCTVSGVSSVTLLRACNPEIFPFGSEFPISKLGSFIYPEKPDVGISVEAWDMAKSAAEIDNLGAVPAEMVRLAKERQQARLRQDWVTADSLRQKITSLGWLVQDTPEGQKIIRQP
ncbi:MAG: cysteinyl-tRNA synthetase [Anaerolineales bacterium]